MQNVRWWDAAAAAVTVVIAAISLLDPPFGADDVGTWAVAGAFLVVHFAWGRRCVPVAAPRAHLAISITYAVLLAVGTAIEPSFAILQAFLYPFVWSTSPNTRSAIVANIAIAVAIVVGYAVRAWPAGLVVGGAVAALSVGFSIALGLWITRIAQFGEERARLLAELQAAQGQLAAMHRDAGVADERARLAREIHDTIAQSLTGMVMVAQRTGRRLVGVEGEAAASARDDVELMEQMAREALTEARGLVASLAPIESDGGLGEALRRLAETFERETGVRVSVTTDAAGLDRELEVVLLRCAQEALANVRKHARASSADIVVTTAGTPPEIVLAVRDDGVGPGDASPGDGGFGLAGMRDRVALVGGRLEFAAGRDGGTVLRVVVPARQALEGRDATAGADA
ncbi:two-component sensor histidine kinase [Agromyces luteolus]|uniref:Sensor histidine kinase n=1 Tax=Agromyces luteolus TaxID=88373 RepID=A0A7C9HZJ0_9MICO|nr:sensor histidine kinase [Agromyces luteolus]MUN07320.1 sensor histidine kinase [Agromyces luteolus]GLK28577.1 two-component sensor histidine kinase [Agromyces luteolus]